MQISIKYFSSFLMLVLLVAPQKIKGRIVPSGCCLTILDGGTIEQPGNYRLGADFTGNIEILADRVTIDGEGREIRAITDGISAVGRQSVTIKNVIIRAAGTNGILFNNCDNVCVENSVLISNFCGIRIQNTRDVVLLGLRALDNTQDGILVDGLSERINAKAIYSARNGRDGWRVENANDVVVRTSEAYRNTECGYNCINAQRTSVLKSIGSDNLQVGIRLENSPCAIIENSEFCNNSRSGILCDGTGLARIRRNWVASNNFFGMEAILSQSLAILDNDFMQSPTGVILSESSDSYVSSNRYGYNFSDGSAFVDCSNMVGAQNSYFLNDIAGLALYNSGPGNFFYGNASYINGSFGYFGDGQMFVLNQGLGNGVMNFFATAGGTTYEPMDATFENGSNLG